MARRTEVVLIDDIDGTPAEGTVRFGIDGQMYTIDLSSEHSQEFFSRIAKFRDNATRVGAALLGGIREPGHAVMDKVGAEAMKERNKAIRAWAAAKGMTINMRGRIPDSIMRTWEHDQRLESAN
jgi:DhnA family fructose-bisphosphate aldolase class Ia